MQRVVIVGAGLAGHRAAQALRRDGFDGDLTIIGDEPHRPYDRPPLSKQLLAGSVDQASCFYHADDLDVNWVLGEAAAGLDVEAQRVRLADGGELPYDALVIATGRRARPLPDPPELGGFHTLRSFDDAEALRQTIRPGVSVAIVGAGFIGCEVAATLRGLGVEQVTMIDIAPYPMAPLGAEIGARAARLHEAHGVKLRLATSVAMFEGNDTVEALRLEDGERIEAQVVLLALGSLPNTEWLAGSPLELVAGNVVCDAHCMAVGVSQIAAAGDIAAYPHPAADGLICIEHWSNARDMGELAGQNLLRTPEDREAFAPVPTFWSDQYDVKIKSAGLLKLADSFTVVEEDLEKSTLVVEALRHGELVGAVVFNRNRTIIGYQRQLSATLVAAHGSA